MTALSLGSTQGVILRRLFSTFARGWPGAGLLMLRLVAAIALFVKALPVLRNGAPSELIGLAVVAVATGALLLAGLWTPVAGTVLTVVSFWRVATQPGDPWARILLGTLGAALVLLGPGAWSIDSRLFGWKRIDVGDKKGIHR